MWTLICRMDKQEDPTIAQGIISNTLDKTYRKEYEKECIHIYNWMFCIHCVVVIHLTHNYYSLSPMWFYLKEKY